MLSFPKAHFPTLVLLAAVATFSDAAAAAADLPHEPESERPGERGPFRLRLSAPLRQKDLLRLEIDLGKGATTSTTSDDAPVQRLERPSGGLGVPSNPESWPDSRAWESEHDFFSPHWRDGERASDGAPESDRLDRYPDDDAWLDDGLDDELDWEESDLREVSSQSWDSFWERLWLHERRLWSLHFYGGQNLTDNLAGVLRGDTHRHPSGLASVGAVRHGGAFFGLYEDAWWWPTWEMEYTFTRRFEDSALNEHNVVPLRARWDLPLGDRLSRHLELSFAVSEGVSFAESIPNVEVTDREKSHEIQNFLAFDVIVGLPFLERFGSFAWHTNLFFRIHHRSDAYGLYPEDGGSNTLTVGVSIGRRRTERRWEHGASRLRAARDRR